MKFTKNEDLTYTLESENRTVTLTANECSFIMNQFMKIDLRDRIKSICLDMDRDTIALEKYPYTFDEFIEEIYVDLEDEIDFGNFPSDEDIEDKIADTADFYEMQLN